MVNLRGSALLLVGLLVACNNDDGDGGASLFGSGGEPVTTTDNANSSEGTTNGLDDGEDDNPPPPPPPDDDSTSGTPPPATGTESGSSSGEESSGETGFDTTNDGVLQVQVINQSMFPQGQCDDVIVTNISDMAVTWEVELMLPGMIDQLWNSEVVEAEGMGTFTGLEFNATLDPGAQAMFGYCVVY